MSLLNHATTTVALLAIALPGLTLADQYTDTGLYLAAGIGMTQVDSNLNLKDDKGAIPRLAAGWQLTPHLGVEAAWHAFLDGEDSTGALAKYDLSGASLTGVLRLPLSPRLAMFAKLGRVWWQSDLADTFCSRGPAGCSTTDYALSESDNLLGIGLSYELTDRLEVELEYENIEFEFDEGTLDLFDNKTSVLAVSLRLSI